MRVFAFLRTERVAAKSYKKRQQSEKRSNDWCCLMYVYVVKFSSNNAYVFLPSPFILWLCYLLFHLYRVCRSCGIARWSVLMLLSFLSRFVPLFVICWKQFYVVLRLLCGMFARQCWAMGGDYNSYIVGTQHIWKSTIFGLGGCHLCTSRIPWVPKRNLGYSHEHEVGCEGNFVGVYFETSVRGVAVYKLD